MENEVKKKWPSKTGTRYEKVVRMTFSEGDNLDKILAQYDCKNISQLCKKIVRDELELKVKG